MNVHAVKLDAVNRLFFFQAEDGIRDVAVTGVQTRALPISLLPKGMAWRLQPGSDLVVEVHMVPSGKAEIVDLSIGLFFGDDSPERTPSTLRLGRQSLDKIGRASCRERV